MSWSTAKRVTWRSTPHRPGWPVRWHGMEPGDEELSELLDEPGELLPLLTLGEARSLAYVAHLLGSGGAAAADAAREMEMRLERRLTVMFPEQAVRLKTALYNTT